MNVPKHRPRTQSYRQPVSQAKGRRMPGRKDWRMEEADGAQAWDSARPGLFQQCAPPLSLLFPLPLYTWVSSDFI